MRRRKRRLWLRCCAAILPAIVALSMIHMASPHSQAPSQCWTCKALDTPALARAGTCLSVPAPPPTPMAAEPAERPVRLGVLHFRPLRAPPLMPVV